MRVTKYIKREVLVIVYWYYAVRYRSTSTLNNWARYINKINKQDLTKLIIIITSKVYA